MTRLSFALCCLLASFSTRADREFHAESFHSKNCTGCHDTSVYTRPDRRVNTLDGLKAQVRTCDANLGIRLFDEDLEALVDYLNRNFYQLAR